MADFSFVVVLAGQVAVGLLMIGLAFPLIWRMVPPNHWYGFRVRRTLEDPKVWYEANTFAGKCLFMSGIVIIVASYALLYPRAFYGPSYAKACTAVDLAAVAASLLLSFRFLGQIEKSPDL